MVRVQFPECASGLPNSEDRGIVSISSYLLPSPEVLTRVFNSPGFRELLKYSDSHYEVRLVAFFEDPSQTREAVVGVSVGR